MGCYDGDWSSAPESVDTIEGRGHDEDRCPKEPATNGERLPQTFSDMPDAASTLFGRAASAIRTAANRVPQPDNARSENRATAFQNQTNRDLGSRNTKWLQGADLRKRLKLAISRTSHEGGTSANCRAEYCAKFCAEFVGPRGTVQGAGVRARWLSWVARLAWRSSWR